MSELPSVPDDSTRKQDTFSLTHSFFQRGDIVGRSLYEALPTKMARDRFRLIVLAYVITVIFDAVT